MIIVSSDKSCTATVPRQYRPHPLVPNLPQYQYQHWTQGYPEKMLSRTQQCVTLMLLLLSWIHLMMLHNQEQPSFNNRFVWPCVIYVWGINSDISRHNPSIDTFQGDNSIQYLCWWHNAAVLVISDWSSQVAFLQLFWVWMVTSNGDIMQQLVPTSFDNQSLWCYLRLHQVHLYCCRIMTL